jgi:hypothetical protein
LKSLLSNATAIASPIDQPNQTINFQWLVMLFHKSSLNAPVRLLHNFGEKWKMISVVGLPAHPLHAARIPPKH